MNRKISTSDNITHSNRLFEETLDDLILYIRSGIYHGRDLKGITDYIRAINDKDTRDRMKKCHLPVAMINGTFSMKSQNCLLEYSSFVAMDFDNFQNEEDLQNIYRRLYYTDCVHAIFRTPSGCGLKAIVMHDNSDSAYHKEMYQQLLAMFMIPNVTDNRVFDLARGQYICYDPNIVVKENYNPYHFVHDPSYQDQTPSKSNPNMAIPKGYDELIDILAFKDVKRLRSDKTVLAIQENYYRKYYGQFFLRDGHSRANGVFMIASRLCQLGVELDKALSWLIPIFTDIGLTKNEVINHALSGYSYNIDDYGRDRYKFDTEKKGQ